MTESRPPEEPRATPHATPRAQETAPAAVPGAPAAEPEPSTAAPAAPPPPAASHPTAAPTPSAPSPAPVKRARRSRLADFVRERDEVPVEIPAAWLRAHSRRDFLLFTGGVIVSAAAAWWLLPDRTRARLLGPGHERLDTLEARLGLTRVRAEGALNRALTFDDDVSEALYSRDRRVRTYDRSQVTPLRNNYDGQTPGPGYLPAWRLRVSGLASGVDRSFSIDELTAQFPIREQVTRLVCVEGWSAVAWWGGIHFADFLAAYPPLPSARWAALRSSVNLDGSGNSDPYYVSIDLDTARHPQALLATQLGGRPLTLGHGAPLRLVVPMKLGLKNIKAITDIAYTADEPRDYWNERGYSKYDGL